MTAGGTRDALEELRKRVESVLDEARAGELERQHALGKRSARERIAMLVDTGSFLETGTLVRPERGSTQHPRGR